MSQNVLVTTSVLGPVRIRAGWDDPLQELFCNVELLRDPGMLPDTAPNCFLEFVYPDLDAMRAALAEAGIVMPPPMLEAVAGDLNAKVGNVVREFKNS